MRGVLVWLSGGDSHSTPHVISHVKRLKGFGWKEISKQLNRGNPIYLTRCQIVGSSIMAETQEFRFPSFIQKGSVEIVALLREIHTHDLMISAFRGR